MSFRPIDGPFGYSFDAVEHIEDRNCSRGHGCLHGAARGDGEWVEVGPGGHCGLLATVSLGDTPVEEMDMDVHGRVTCRAYEARPAPPPPAPPVEPIPAGQLMIEGWT